MNSQSRTSQYNSQNYGVAPTVSVVPLPTQIVEMPTAVHEQIRAEQVEEIQPVVQVEKFKTEVIQMTQPLMDREIRAVNVQERTLATEILPEVIQQNGQQRSLRDTSSVEYLQGANLVVEKPPVFMETDKVQIIEEIQPVIYKETIVPTVIRETKPVYQKIVEGPIYVHQTLPTQQLNTSGYHYPADQSQQFQQGLGNQPFTGQRGLGNQPQFQQGLGNQPFIQSVPIQQGLGNQSSTGQSVPIQQSGMQQQQPGMLKERQTTVTSTTTNAPYQPLQQL